MYDREEAVSVRWAGAHADSEKQEGQTQAPNAGPHSVAHTGAQEINRGDRVVTEASQARAW